MPWGTWVWSLLVQWQNKEEDRREAGGDRHQGQGWPLVKADHEEGSQEPEAQGPEGRRQSPDESGMGRFVRQFPGTGPIWDSEGRWPLLEDLLRADRTLPIGVLRRTGGGYLAKGPVRKWVPSHPSGLYASLLRRKHGIHSKHSQ